MGHGNRQNMYITFICKLLVFLSCPWGISMRWIYGVKLKHDWTGLNLVETETKEYRIVYVLPQLFHFGLELCLRGLSSNGWKPGITLVLAGHN